jgi:hypothetical protein
MDSLCLCNVSGKEEAIVHLFYDQTYVPPQNDPWWNEMSHVLSASHGGSSPLVGKRKRAAHFSDENGERVSM